MIQPPTAPAHEAEFLWLTGFECSFPRPVDELEKTGHYTHWGSDLLRVRALGLRALRYGIPWHRVQRAPGHFDWSWLDGPMALMRELGLEPIVDLVHFGTPRWLRGAFANPAYPALAAEYALAFAARYPWVRDYTPVNEPSITAALCGELAYWYPRGRGLESYVRMLEHLARSVVLMTRAIRDTAPVSRLVWVDSGEHHHGRSERGQRRAEFLNHKRFLAHDLIWGRLGLEHPLRPWLLQHGMAEERLEWFAANGAGPDVLGLDYYVHSEILHTPGRRRLAPPGVRLGLGGVARQYHRRYGVPLMVTETDADGSVDERIAWLDATVAEVNGLRAEGVPMVGYCWWPAVSHIDWDSGLRRNRGTINPVGLYDLVREPDGRLTRVETALTDRFKQYVAGHGADPVPPRGEGVGLEAN